MQMVAYRFMRQSVVFYAAEPIPRYRDLDRLAERLDRAPQAVILTTDQHETNLHERFPGQLEVLTRRDRFLRPGEVVVLARRADSDAFRTAGRVSAHEKH
jgi:hypothetical protein